MSSETDILEMLTDEEFLSVEELAGKCLAQGSTLGDVRGYTDDELEAVYSLAHNAYAQGRYEEAERLCRFLVTYQHLDSRFWIALAACHQMSRHYEEAATAYGVAAVLDATNPLPSLYACECFAALEDWDNASKTLEAVEVVCEANEGEADHSEVRRWASLLAERVESAAVEES